MKAGWPPRIYQSIALLIKRFQESYSPPARWIEQGEARSESRGWCRLDTTRKTGAILQQELNLEVTKLQSGTRWERDGRAPAGPP